MIDNLAAYTRSLECDLADCQALIEQGDRSAGTRRHARQLKGQLQAVTRFQMKHGLPGPKTDPTYYLTPRRGGRPQCWVVIREACQALPGSELRIRDIASKARELFPNFKLNVRAMSRDMTRRPELWRNLRYGVWSCLWKVADEDGDSTHELHQRAQHQERSGKVAMRNSP